MRKYSFKITTVKPKQVIEELAAFDEAGYEIINVLGPVPSATGSVYSVVGKKPRAVEESDPS
jgi:hypothetical protein